MSRPHIKKTKMKRSKARAAINRGNHHAASHRTGGARRMAAKSSGPVSPESTAETESERTARARDSYSQGNERLFLGDATGAITAYKEAILLNPKDPAGYRGLGLAHAQRGKRTEAIRYLRAYLKRAPQADDRALIADRIALLEKS